jgi:orotate phosphoribosyltransferase-like protein
MERIKLLDNDWGYPVIRFPAEMTMNLVRVKDLLLERYHYDKIHITSIGTSGAMLMGGLATINALFGKRKINAKFVQLRRAEDTTAQGKHYVDFDDWDNTPIVIIDDHITYGNSMKLMAQLIEEKRVKQNVVGVVAMAWDKDNPEYVEPAHKLLEELFPNIKFWIH